jgi:hypothetical protein
LSRVVYMRPPRQLLDKFAGKVLRVKKPLYGITDAPSYWYDAYIPAFLSPPTSMEQSFLDECLLFASQSVTTSGVDEKRYSPRVRDTEWDKFILRTAPTEKMSIQLEGIAGVLVDDALLTGTPSLASNEKSMHERFENSGSTAESLEYAGAKISQSCPPGYVTVHQTTYIDALQSPVPESWNFATVRTYRGRLSWLTAVTRPDIGAVVARLASWR